MVCSGCALRYRSVGAHGGSHMEFSYDHGKTWRRREGESSRCVPLTTTKKETL